MYLSKSMKTFSLYLILSLFSLHSYTQNSSGVNKDGLLWSISGNGLNRPSFLLGTNHAMHYYYLDSIPAVWETFNSVNQIVSEILLEGSTIYKDVSTNNIIDFKLFGTNTKRRNNSIFFNYKECLNENDYVYLQNIYHSFSGTDNLESTKLIPLDLFDWFNRAFYLDFEQKFNNGDNEFRSKSFFFRNYLNITEPIWMDHYLQQKAVQNNYSIVGLETLTDREGLNKEQEYEVQKIKKKQKTDTSTCTLARNLIRYLKIKAEDNFEPDIIKLHKLYINQNVLPYEQRETDEISFDSLWLYDSVSRNKLSLLYNKYRIKMRNQNWMKRLPDIINKRASFIAVGLNHLTGEYGLINLLRREGYIVEPVEQIKKTTPMPLAKGIVDIRKENIEYEFDILERTSYNEEWLSKFKTLTLYTSSWFGDSYSNRLNQLKSKITDEDIIRNEDYFDFYLRPHFSRWDTITDLLLYDVEENKKQLLDIRTSDKYLILCFWKATNWSISQISEIPISAKAYKDKLDIIYINIDNDIQEWQECSKRLNLTKYNFRLNTDNGNTFSRYLESIIINKKIPNFYYLISPDNRILNVQSYFFNNNILNLHIKP